MMKHRLDRQQMVFDSEGERKGPSSRHVTTHVVRGKI